ncbi:MAG: type II toxin-antitoxin system VapC family toxin [Gammaproteobacteria bacterium]
MLTDTTFWVDLLLERRTARRGAAHRFLARHRAAALRVSIITWGELAEGFTASAALDAVLHHVRVLPLHRHVAWEASRIARELRGERLAENDNWIAATARAWGLALVGRDAAFARVPRLRVVRY